MVRFRESMSDPVDGPGVDLERAIHAEQFPVGVFWTDPEGSCYAVNPRWCELSGLTEVESRSHGWMRAIHPDDRDRVAYEKETHLLEGRNLRIEFRLVRPDGRLTWVLSQVVPSRDSDGSIQGFMGTITDITGRVTAEAALRESEERFRNLVELSPDFIGIHRGGVLEYVNAAGLRMMRAELPSALVGHHILEFVLPEHQELAVSRMGAVKKGDSIPLTEMEVHRCDREAIWIETVASSTVWDGQPAVQLVARDVTDRHKTAETYRGVVEGVRDALWVLERGKDGHWRPSFVNEHYVRAGRLASAQDVLGKTLHTMADEGLITPENAHASEARYNEVAGGDRPVEFEEETLWNGAIVAVATMLTPVRNALGKCDQLICWSRDVSHRRAHELALAESEANYRAVVEGTSDAVWVMDRGRDEVFRVSLANSKAEQMLGFPLAAAIGKSLHEVLSPAAAARASARYSEADSSGGPIEYENVIERPGLRIEVVTHLTPLYDENGRCYRIIGSARDVTDRRRAESALLQAQKLESLGVLAGGIAHDFNNLLTTILGNLYLLDSELPEDSPLRDYTSDSRVAGLRGADLVKRLLGFSRPGIHQREPIAIASLLDETVSLIRRTLGPAIHIDVATDDNGAAVSGEFSALQQVLLNLLFNARDAMPDGGRIDVALHTRTIGPEPVWEQRAVSPGAYWEILVMDSGSGMPRDVLQRIFDPFFTTKGVGKGTGLGLSTALSIVRAHGGWLEAESEEGTGSTFRLLLPAG